MSKYRLNMRTAGTNKRFLSSYASARSTTESQVVAELLTALKNGQVEIKSAPPKTDQLNLRLPDELGEWLDDHVTETGTNKSKLVNELLGALKEGRIVAQSSLAPNPFPADSE